MVVCISSHDCHIIYINLLSLVSVTARSVALNTVLTLLPHWLNTAMARLLRPAEARVRAARRRPGSWRPGPGSSSRAAPEATHVPRVCSPDTRGERATWLLGWGPHLDTRVTCVTIDVYSSVLTCPL